MKLTKRQVWLGIVAIGVIVLLTLSMAPHANRRNQGSTYNRSPDGYGAWYAYMEKQGTPVKRWQKPSHELAPNESPATLLRVHSDSTAGPPSDTVKNWVRKGNTLVVLGVRTPVTAAEFSTLQESPVGQVKIDTRRRLQSVEDENQRLGDRFGAIVWEQTLGKGKIIVANTPYLAANAYQDYPGNYKFLAQLATETGKSIWVDEYIHGYKDAEVRNAENAGSWVGYLAKTPLLPMLVQAGILLLVLVWAQNQRFGPPTPFVTPRVDNSEAYIQALAGVLQKAGSSEFILEMVGKEEQLQLQKALGLGTVPMEQRALIDAWVQQTQRPASQLEQVLQMQAKGHRISERDLLLWLEKWQALRAEESSKTSAASPNSNVKNPLS